MTVSTTRALVAVMLIATLPACSGGGGGTSAAPVESSAPQTSPTDSPRASGGPSSTPTVAPALSPSPTISPTPFVSPRPSPTPSVTASATPPKATPTAYPSGALAAAPASLIVASGLYVDIVSSTIPAPRQLAALPNGDLLVGTLSSAVYIVPSAESATSPLSAKLFATLPDSYAQGVSYSPVSNAIYVATNQHVYEIPYETGDLSARSMQSIVNVRTGAVSNLAPAGDTDVHHTTSVLASGNDLYVSVGSSCNACAETDPTRAVVLRTSLTGGMLTTVATRVRNAIAMGASLDGHVWIGGAGQDCLPQATSTCAAMSDTYESSAHPYEWADDLTAAAANAANLKPGVADYAWPVCEENGRAARSFASPAPGATALPANVCENSTVRQAQPLVEFPAYTTHIGLAVYQPSQTGAYKLPAPYNDALIVTSHGSWHENAAGSPVAEPDVAFVSLVNGKPAVAANFSNPTAQYDSILSNYQDAQGTRIGQPTGVAIGSQGSLFVADDYAGFVYRVRPGFDPNTFLEQRTPAIRRGRPASLDRVPKL